MFLTLHENDNMDFILNNFVIITLLKLVLLYTQWARNNVPCLPLKLQIIILKGLESYLKRIVTHELWKTQFLWTSVYIILLRKLHCRPFRSHKLHKLKYSNTSSHSVSIFASGGNNSLDYWFSTITTPPLLLVWGHCYCNTSVNKIQQQCVCVIVEYHMIVVIIWSCAPWSPIEESNLFLFMANNSRHVQNNSWSNVTKVHRY